MGVTYPCANSRIWRRNISTTSSSRTCLVCLRKSRTPLPASTLTQSVVGWPHTQVWPSSWGSPGRSPSALRWRPSSSGVSAGQGTTERGHQRLHTVLGHWPRFLRSHSQLLPQRIRLQRPQVRHQGGQTEELRARLHDRGEVCWGTRLPHCRGYGWHGGGTEDRS